MGGLIPRHLGGIGAYNGMRCIREETSVLKEGYRRRVQFLVPSSGRKDEQGYLRAWEILCRNKGFRQEIQGLQQRFQETLKKYDANQANRASIDVERLCERWGIKGVEWVFWLMENWDLDQADLPPREPPEIMPALGNWILKVEYLTQPETGEQPYQAVLTMAPGISVREAQKAATQAVKAIRPLTRAKGTRPGLTELDREILLEVFADLGIAPPRGREKVIQKAVAMMKDLGRPLSHSKMASEYRSWLVGQGQSIKRYDRQ